MDNKEIANIVNRVLTEQSKDTKELLEQFEASIRARENALEVEENILGAVADVDEPDEQFLTMECFEEINYHFLQTSKISISFTKGCMFKDI
jgi:hypothetical protein